MEEVAFFAASTKVITGLFLNLQDTFDASKSLDATNMVASYKEITDAINFDNLKDSLT
jgi:hypothetical protein